MRFFSSHYIHKAFGKLPVHHECTGKVIFLSFNLSFLMRRLSCDALAGAVGHADLFPASPRATKLILSLSPVTRAGLAASDLGVSCLIIAELWGFFKDKPLSLLPTDFS